MNRLHWLAAIVGLLAVTVAQAPARDEPVTKSVEKSTGQESDDCCYNGDSPGCIRKLCHWAIYRPYCNGTPCDATYGPRYYPPLHSYFTCSPYYKCYKKYDGCDCNQSLFGNWFGKRCKSCEKGCAEKKGPLVVTITFPGISITRSRDCTEPCDACPPPKPARPSIRERLTSWTGKNAACDECPPEKVRGPILSRLSTVGDWKCRKRFFSGRIIDYIKGRCWSGGCGGCDYGKQCCNKPIYSPVDLDHMPIVSPDSLTGAPPGHLKAVPPRIPATAPAPLPKAEPLPVPAK